MIFQRDIPVVDEYEVIVVGGGPAGCTAAAASAREGAKTLLIESTASLGGMGTNGLVPFWCGFSNGGKLVNRGLAQVVLENLAKRMDDDLYKAVHEGADEPEKYPWRVGIDAEQLKRVYDDLVTGYGADVLFKTTLSAVETNEEGEVTAVIVTNKAGLTAYKAKVFIDCTGEGDLIAWAGGKYLLGDEEGNMQAGTLCFTLVNADMEEYHKVNMYHIFPTENPEEYDLIYDNFSTTAVLGSSSIGFNAGHLPGVNSIDPVSVSQNTIKGRRLVEQLVKRLKEKYPKIYGNARIGSTAVTLGTREGRRIVGDYVLKDMDYINRASFSDEIARNCYELDSHDLNKKQDDYDKYPPYAPGESHGIPYRSLCPVNLKNVLVAGRIISAERRVLGASRIMATCLSTGEAAGLASALAVKSNNNDIHAVDVDLLRKKLKDYGAYIR